MPNNRDAYNYYNNLRKRMKKNPHLDRLFFVGLMTFITISAFFQGMPAMFEGGLDKNREKYRLYFNYLCPELQKLILGNGANWTNVGISGAASFTFASLALVGVKEMVAESDPGEIKKYASWASTIYSILASAPGAFLTAKYFPDMFEDEPFKDLNLNPQAVVYAGWGIGAAVFCSNLSMFGFKIGEDVVTHSKQVITTLKNDPNRLKRFGLPMVALYTLYMQTLQQGASSAKYMQEVSGMPIEAASLIVAIPSVAYADFVYKVMMDMAVELYDKFICEVCSDDGIKVKKAFELMFTPRNALYLLINIILFLPMFAMFLYWTATSVEMSYSEKTFNSIIDNDMGNFLHVILPSLQGVITTLHLVFDTPGIFRSLGKRLRDGPPKVGPEGIPLLGERPVNSGLIEG